MSRSPKPEHYSYGEVEASLCVWEWLLETCHETSTDERRETIRDLFENYGSGGMRSSAIQAGIIVEACWKYADQTGSPWSNEIFDWEFVPALCRLLDWTKLPEDNQYSNAEWRPNTAALVETLNALKAIGVPA
jgi:hypothetical protein